MSKQLDIPSPSVSIPRKPTWDAELYEARHSFVWQFGESLLGLLDPKPGERILDLGCGPGQLTGKIRESGATVVGLDSSPDMIGQARQNFPSIPFALGNAEQLSFEEEFDAIFSNAALHWMLNASAVASGMDRALRKGGRLVAELGGQGNIAQIEGALDKVGANYFGAETPPHRNFFPSVSEYSSILEAAGFEVRFAQLFDRPTPLEGEDGMKNWLIQFRGFFFAALSSEQKERALAETVEELRPLAYSEGGWSADYRRLRIIAVKR